MESQRVEVWFDRHERRSYLAIRPGLGSTLYGNERFVIHPPKDNGPDQVNRYLGTDQKNGKFCEWFEVREGDVGRLIASCERVLSDSPNEITFAEVIVDGQVLFSSET